MTRFYLGCLLSRKPDGLQLIMGGRRCGQLGHRHHVNHHTGPAGEVLSALAVTSVGVVLLPGESSLLPLPEDVLDQVLAQSVVQLACPFPVGTGSSRGVL